MLDTLRELIQREMRRNRITGASVSIVHEDETVLCEGFGWADRAGHVRAEGSTLFRIGSISKVFTALAVMKLAEQGTLDIDKPVAEYVPGFAVRHRFVIDSPVTVRDVLCHHAGLPCDDLKDYFTDDLTAFHSAVSYLRNAYMVCPPRTMFYYSNLGYELLGLLVSRVTGIPFDRYMDSVVLPGLSMPASAIRLSSALSSRLAKPYRRGREQVEPAMKGIPEGGIHSSAQDMAAFMKCMLDKGRGLFLDSDTLDSMWTTQYPDNPIDMDFRNGLGWFVGRPGLDYAGKVVWHDGGTPNYFSLVTLIPERKLGIALLTNSADGALMNHRTAVAILNLLMNRFYGIDATSTVDRAPAGVPAESLEPFTGRFLTTSGPVSVALSRRGLVARMASGTLRLRPCRDGWFDPTMLLLGFLPLRLAAVSAIRLGFIQSRGQRVLALEQLGFKSPRGVEFRPLKASEAWKARAGSYICSSEENPRLKHFELTSTPDGMTVSCSSEKMGRLEMFLDTVSDTEAVIMGCGRYAGETIFAHDDVVGLFGLDFTRTETRRHGIVR